MPSKTKTKAKTTPRFTAGYSDGSGGDCVRDNQTGQTLAVTTWGCSCCKPEPTAEDFATAGRIADALNAQERRKRR